MNCSHSCFIILLDEFKPRSKKKKFIIFNQNFYLKNIKNFTSSVLLCVERLKEPYKNSYAILFTPVFIFILSSIRTNVTNSLKASMLFRFECLNFKINCQIKIYLYFKRNLLSKII